MLTVLLGGGAHSEEPPEAWAKGFTSEGAGKTGLQLVGVVQGEEGLYGFFLYFNFSKDGRTGPILIAGSRSQSEIFWANARFLVKKTATSEWQAVAESTPKGVAETMTVPSDKASRAFRIELDAFKRYMSTHKMGRVVISSGAVAEFQLEALLPPAR